MSDLQFYYSKSCPYAQRTRIVLQEKGINFTAIEVDLKNKSDDFKKVSRYGKVHITRGNSPSQKLG